MTEGRPAWRFLDEKIRDRRKQLEDPAANLLGRLKKCGMPGKVRARLEPEIKRLEKGGLDPEKGGLDSNTEDYLDCLADLPWDSRTEETIDLARTLETLDGDHSGIEKAKDRILEYLAVRMQNPGVKGPILCFVGPPGVGKTSLAQSIAESIGRKFVRVSLGGMRGEAEIRGHRRTYISALPGQIMQGLRRAGSKNPVLVLDEIDKVGGPSVNGDPASALLEVLDPEQNPTFRDHYVALPFDLSEVLFITTANVLDPIPPALRDRMEVLELPGYTEEEKLVIATEHLLGRQIKEHGLTAGQVRFTEAALRAVIRGYTREAGVRNLKREIGALCRKVARRRAEGNESPVEITAETVVGMLGAPKHFDEEVAERTKKRPGVAIGLAWTSVGGDMLFVEARRMRGRSGNDPLILTGNLGAVMKESARIAVSWVRANADLYRDDYDFCFLENNEVHLHVPSGAISKDGPSAGVTMVVALVSELTRHHVRGDFAMTGEIDLSGNVLPVGGIREKVLAARRFGIGKVVLPKQNEKDVKEDLDEHLQRYVRYVSTIEEVLDLVLLPPQG